MSKGAIREKNQKMADYMKRKGIRRTTTQCPHTHHPVGLNSLVDHLRSCQAGLHRRVK
jgi:hypothetical protein